MAEDMITRAARVLASYVREAEREIAMQTLTAALDPEDYMLCRVVMDTLMIGHSQARDAIAALKAHAQGVP